METEATETEVTETEVTESTASHRATKQRNTITEIKMIRFVSVSPFLCVNLLPPSPQFPRKVEPCTA